MNVFKLFLIMGVTLLGSCSTNDEPYVIFENSSGERITEQVVAVDLNSAFELYVHIGYDEDKGESNMLYYEQQFENEPVTDLVFTDQLEILTVGIHNNLTIVEAKIDIPFKGDKLKSGSEVKITVRDKWILRNTLTFKVR